MRITIETDSPESVSVTQDGQIQQLGPQEATDGGGAPQDLVELLSGSAAQDGLEQDASATNEPEDAGSAPDWLVDVIEGSSPIGPGGPAEA